MLDGVLFTQEVWEEMIRKRIRTPLIVANKMIDPKHPTAGAWLTSPSCKVSAHAMPKRIRRSHGIINAL